MSKTIIGVSIKVNGEKHEFTFECPYLTASIWNNNQYDCEILNGYIDAAIIEYKNTKKITEETDSGSMNFAPHFYE